LESATAEIGNPEGEAGQAAEGAAPATETPDNPESAAGSEAAEGAETPEGEQTTDEEVLPLDLRGLDRDKIAPELRPMYDQLVATYKSMQAGLTPKLQEGAAAIEAKTVLEQQVEALTAQVTALKGGQPQVQAAADPNDESIYYAGLGAPITPAMLMAEDAAPDTLLGYIDQRATVMARKIGRQVIDMLAPQVQQVAQTVSSRDEAAALSEVNAFFAANPDVEPYRAEMSQLYAAGVAATIEEAADRVRAYHLGDKKVTQAFELGAAAAKERAEQVRDNQGRFAVPSGATKPAGGASLLPKGAPLKDVLAAATADIPG
jgi:hypothetical protein